MITRRLLVLLAGLGLAATSLGAPAWAHPGHGPIGGAAASPQVRTGSRDGGEGEPARPREHAPPAAALVAGALALLAGLPHRRRTLALALAAVLATAAFEGVFHAALHLGHVPHTDGLAIGAAAIPPAATDPHAAAPAAPPLARLGEAPYRYDPAVTDVVVSSNQGRAPPPPSV